MVTVHVDFTANDTFAALNKETVISGNVFPLIDQTTYSDLGSTSSDISGYGYIFTGTGIISVNIPKAARYILDFTYPMYK